MAIQMTDIRVRSVLQRFKLQGFSVWAFLRDALQSAGPDGIPTDDATLGVIADFFPLRLEQVMEIIDYCDTIHLFYIDVDGNLHAEPPTPDPTEPTTPDRPRRGESVDTTKTVAQAQAQAAATPKPTLVACAAAAAASASAPAAPDTAPDAAPARPAERTECYMDGNVCRTRTVPAAAPAAPEIYRHAAPIAVDVPLWDGSSYPSDEEASNNKALKVCYWWNDFAHGCAPARRLTRGLAARIGRFIAASDSAGLGLYDTVVDLCRDAADLAHSRAAAGLQPLTIDEAFSDSAIDRFCDSLSARRDRAEADAYEANYDIPYDENAPDIERPQPDDIPIVRQARAELRRRRLAEERAAREAKANPAAATQQGQCGGDGGCGGCGGDDCQGVDHSGEEF